MSKKKESELEELIKNLGMEGNLIDMPEADKEALILNIEEDVERYRLMNYKKVIESQEEISTFVLTS